MRMGKGRKMSEILKEFYRGNVTPCEKYGGNRREIMDLLRLIDTTREQLLPGMTEEQKKILVKFENSLSMMNTLICEDSFVTGYRLGAQMTMEVLAED